MPRPITEFTQLFSCHYNDALRYARGLCSSWSPDDAEDVLQNSLFTAIENFDSLKDDSKFKQWLFTIITRSFYQAIRKHFWKNFLPLDTQAYLEDIPEVYDRFDKSEKSEILMRALSGLNKKERVAILLFEIAEFSIEEIKVIQKEKSLSAVKSRLSRARTKMKDIITKEESYRYKSPGDYSGDIKQETIKLIGEVRTNEH